MRSVPWMTDESVGFINARIIDLKKRRGEWPHILEFGSGASTMYFAPRSSRLVTFEHDQEWHAKVRSYLDLEGHNHASLHLFERPYSERVAETIADTKFDIISIDGRDRLACLLKVLALGSLDEDGFIVIDNTERITGYDKRYAPMVDALDANDFRHIHFEQIGHDRTGWLAPHRWITTVAWRRGETQYTSKGLIL